MRQKTTQILYAYWNEVRGDRLAPKRFDIEPGRIANILSETFILERAPDGDYPFRLAGTRICEVFGTEFRGLNFLDAWAVDDRLTLERQLQTAAQQGGVVVFAFEALGQDPARSAAFEGILLPLTHQNGGVLRFLGSLSPLLSPPWLGVERLKAWRLIDHELIWPDGRPHAVADKMRQESLAEVRRGQNVVALSGARIVRGERRAFRVLEGGLKGDPNQGQ
ncbi:MAG: hypothetical protein RL291_125 [Pseudomonadota bacterium]